jgi:transcriptional regulator with XRE-family HTH domain
MDTVISDINQRIAAQARDLRAARGLSLDALAAKCGVSRSMISLIERGEASPTAVVLERLATGLGVPMARLFDEAAEPRPVARRDEQVEWRDPASGYVRRNVSPPGWPSPVQIVAVDFPAGARVAYETGHREHPIHQQIWVLSGRMRVTVGDEQYDLDAGDCLAMQLDRPTSFANRTRQRARYAVVIAP